MKEFITQVITDVDLSQIILTRDVQAQQVRIRANVKACIVNKLDVKEIHDINIAVNKTPQELGVGPAVIAIYKAVLERERNPNIAYLEMLYAHNCGALSRIGLWLPREFFCDVFLKLWEDRWMDSYEPWRQVAVTASLLWLWLIGHENQLNAVDKVFLKDQKMRLFFLIPDLFEKQSVSPYAKDPRMPVKIQFDEPKFAYRCLVRSVLDENEDENEKKIEKIKTLLH